MQLKFMQNLVNFHQKRCAS